MPNIELMKTLMPMIHTFLKLVHIVRTKHGKIRDLEISNFSHLGRLRTISLHIEYFMCWLHFDNNIKCLEQDSLICTTLHL